MMKDKKYQEHLKAMELDRHKEFRVPGESTTEHYIRQWCAENGLKHDAETAKLRRRKRVVGPKRKLP